MGDVVQFRDFQSKDAIERAHKALEEHLNQQAIQIANEAFPSVFGFGPEPGLAGAAISHPELINPYSPQTHWPKIYRAEEKDPA